MFESFDGPFYWSAPFCVLILPKSLVCRIVWCVGCVNCTPVVATAPADTVWSVAPLLARIIQL